MIYPISILYKYLSNFHNSRLYCPSSPRIRATPRKISKIHTLKSLIYAPINVSIASLYMSSSLSLNVSKLCHAYVRFMSCICTNHEQRNGRKKNKWNGFYPMPFHSLANASCLSVTLINRFSNHAASLCILR